MECTVVVVSIKYYAEEPNYDNYFDNSREMTTFAKR